MFDNPMIPNLDGVLSSLEAIESPSSFMYSDTQFEILKKYISDYEKTLDEEHEVGMILTNFGHSVTMQVTNIGYEKYALMVYKGFVNGNPATLIQHVSQINFLLTSIPKPDDRPKQKIGFDLTVTN